MPPTVVVSMQRAASNVADAASAPTDALVIGGQDDEEGKGHEVARGVQEAARDRLSRAAGMDGHGLDERDSRWGFAVEVAIRCARLMCRSMRV
jgi:hypothetical protein